MSINQIIYSTSTAHSLVRPSTGYVITGERVDSHGDVADLWARGGIDTLQDAAEYLGEWLDSPPVPDGPGRWRVEGSQALADAGYFWAYWIYDLALGFPVWLDRVLRGVPFYRERIPEALRAGKEVVGTETKDPWQLFDLVLSESPLWFPYRSYSTDRQAWGYYPNGYALDNDPDIPEPTTTPDLILVETSGHSTRGQWRRREVKLDRVTMIRQQLADLRGELATIAGEPLVTGTARDGRLADTPAGGCYVIETWDHEVDPLGDRDLWFASVESARAYLLLRAAEVGRVPDHDGWRVAFGDWSLVIQRCD